MTNTTATPTDVRYCADGCGAQVTGKAAYRPGHDARHVSVLVAAAVEDGFSDASRSNGEDALASTALRLKFNRAFDNARTRQAERTNRAARRAAPKDATAYRTLDGEGTVKIGRWTYPARRWVRMDTAEFWLERNTARDGSGEWVDFGDGATDSTDDMVKVKGAKRIREALHFDNAKAA